MKLLKFFGYGFSKETPRYRFFIIFSILWFLIAGASFSWFIVNDKSLIWSADGWDQHYKALVYYGKYLREIGKNIWFDHQLIIPQYDFNISEGADILHVLNYYVIGDPLALSSAFVPEKHTHVLYSVLNILRMYFAGISFCVMSFGQGKRNRYGIFAGAITYSFCMWALLNAARHPYFLNPMIYMPLIILGIEKVFRKERPYLLIITMAVTAASNFYFFQMIIIISAVYTVVRCICLYGKKIKNIILNLLKVIGMISIGIGIAGIIFIPVMAVFINDNRVSTPHIFNLFYPLSYYCKLPGTVLSTGFNRWLLVGMTPTAFLSCFLVFKDKRKNTFIKILFIICCLIIVFPVGGRLLNGLSYETNRWCWSFLLLCSYILVLKWDNLISLKVREKIYLFACGTGFFLVSLFIERSKSSSLFSAIIILFATLFVASQNDIFHKKTRQIIICIFTVVSVILMAFWFYSPYGINYISEMKENKKIAMNEYEDEIKALKDNVSTPVQRCSGKDVSLNSGMAKGVSSTDYFWTLSNPNLGKYRHEMELNNQLSNSYVGYDDRTTLLSLSVVDYYVTLEKDSKGIPYGYKKIATDVVGRATKQRHINDLKKEKEVENISIKQNNKISESYDSINIYKNNLSLPLAYCYDSYISESQWNSMDALHKQQAQLSGVYIAEADTTEITNEYREEKAYYEIPFDVNVEDEVVYKDGCFITTKDDAKVKISFQDVENSEIYIELKGFEATPVKTYDLYFGSDDVDPDGLYNIADWDHLSQDKKIEIINEKKYWDPSDRSKFTISFSTSDTKKICNYYTEYYQFYEDTHDFLINMGYEDETQDYLEITFPFRGVYAFSDMNIYAVEFDDYKEKILDLRENIPDKIEYGTDKLNIRIDPDKNVLMCVAIPFQTGWSVTVDGVPEKIYKANDRYLGVILTKGEHDVELRYNRPFQKEGVALTIVGVAAFVTLLIIVEVRRKKKKNIYRRCVSDRDDK